MRLGPRRAILYAALFFLSISFMHVLVENSTMQDEETSEQNMKGEFKLTDSSTYYNKNRTITYHLLTLIKDRQQSIRPVLMWSQYIEDWYLSLNN